MCHSYNFIYLRCGHSQVKYGRYCARYLQQLNRINDPHDSRFVPFQDTCRVLPRRINDFCSDCAAQRAAASAYGQRMGWSLSGTGGWT
jgi:hypothetical protein